MTTVKIGLDIDEVICDWVDAWLLKYNIKNKPTVWEFDDKIHDRFLEMKNNPGEENGLSELDEFYLKLKPLVESSELPFEPHCYITSRPVSSYITERWLHENKFPTKKVFTVPVRKSKSYVAKQVGIDFFIDDAYHNFIDLNENGITTYLLTREHNKNYDVGHLRINSLDEFPLIKSLSLSI